MQYNRPLAAAGMSGTKTVAQPSSCSSTTTPGCQLDARHARYRKLGARQQFPQWRNRLVYRRPYSQHGVYQQHQGCKDEKRAQQGDLNMVSERLDQPFACITAHVRHLDHERERVSRGSRLAFRGHNSGTPRLECFVMTYDSLFEAIAASLAGTPSFEEGLVDLRDEGKC